MPRTILVEFDEPVIVDAWSIVDRVLYELIMTIFGRCVDEYVNRIRVSARDDDVMGRVVEFIVVVNTSPEEMVRLWDVIGGEVYARLPRELHTRIAIYFDVVGA